jgi:hypothetical protein
MVEVGRAYWLVYGRNSLRQLNAGGREIRRTEPYSCSIVLDMSLSEVALERELSLLLSNESLSDTSDTSDTDPITILSINRTGQSGLGLFVPTECNRSRRRCRY